MNDPFFRQSFCLKLKKQIRDSKDHLIIGIDVAKNKHNAFFGTATGKTLFKRLVFENTIEGYKKASHPDRCSIDTTYLCKDSVWP